MRTTKEVVKIFGCGNVIMGDDAYGPSVIDKINDTFDLPDNIEAVDVGTCVREYLFDYLLTEEGRPDRIIILDAVDFTDKKRVRFLRSFLIKSRQKKSMIFPFTSFPP